MKKSIIIAIAATLSIEFAYSQTGFLGKYMPGVLVQNELTPEIYKLEYQASLSKGTYKSEAPGNPELKVKHNTFTIAPAYPFTFINKEDHQLFFGGGFTYHNFSAENKTNVATPQKSFYSYYSNFYLSTRISQKWYITTFLQFADNETKAFDDFSNGFNVMSLAKFNYHPNQNINIGIGAFFNSNNKSPVVLPAISFTYGDKKQVLTIDFPVKVQYEYLLNRGKIRPVIGMNFPAYNYFDKANNIAVSGVGQSAFLGARFKILDFLYLNIQGETLFNEEIKAGPVKDTKKVGKVSSEFRLTTGLSVQFSKFYRK